MDKEKHRYFEKKLLEEKDSVYSLLNQMEENETFFSKGGIADQMSLLSAYDNHPSVMATELFFQEQGYAFKGFEITRLKRIDKSLVNINEGSYGVCKRCGKEIPMERLELMPCVEFCVDCQEAIDDVRPREKNNRPAEEDLILHDDKFGFAFNDFDNPEEEAGFDAEDSYQAVQRIDWRENVDYEFMDEDTSSNWVDPMDQISNQQSEHILF